MLSVIIVSKSTSPVLSHKSISEVYSVAYLTSSLEYIIDVQANMNKIELLLLPAPHNLLLSQYFPPQLRAIPFFQFSTKTIGIILDPSLYLTTNVQYNIG